MEACDTYREIKLIHENFRDTDKPLLDGDKEDILREMKAAWPSLNDANLIIHHEVAHAEIHVDVKAAHSVIKKPPGSDLKSALSFLYTKKSFERVFEPIIEDMRFEHCEALRSGDVKKARWTHVRGVIGIFATMVIHAASSGGKMAVKLWKMGS
ncbi:hypothetical protein [Methylobacterium haplocladii]|uniref:Uncharacterized protein n=1 Tax=Methylobacterium haplocladii TaxID=1176176 RepID=A0A512IS51_9HYPH|nr:hypothetical protein [Methylobacterium haplocladii]GEP00540.1 hypothetical protein MHA02_29270 [Methylobacterium haplocladii]GLS57840.1 hypothetical protein GCM10007887_04960 [Methylobacterium haplocladii]